VKKISSFLKENNKELLSTLLNNKNFSFFDLIKSQEILDEIIKEKNIKLSNNLITKKIYLLNEIKEKVLDWNMKAKDFLSWIEEILKDEKQKEKIINIINRKEIESKLTYNVNWNLLKNDIFKEQIKATHWEDYLNQFKEIEKKLIDNIIKELKENNIKTEQIRSIFVKDNWIVFSWEDEEKLKKISEKFQDKLELSNIKELLNNKSIKNTIEKEKKNLEQISKKFNKDKYIENVLKKLNNWNKIFINYKIFKTIKEIENLEKNTKKSNKENENVKKELIQEKIMQFKQEKEKLNDVNVELRQELWNDELYKKNLEKLIEENKDFNAFILLTDFIKSLLYKNIKDDYKKEKEKFIERKEEIKSQFTIAEKIIKNKINNIEKTKKPINKMLNFIYWKITKEQINKQQTNLLLTFDDLLIYLFSLFKKINIAISILNIIISLSILFVFSNLYWIYLTAWKSILIIFITLTSIYLFIKIEKAIIKWEE